MSKDSSPKYYQNNKERQKKKGSWKLSKEGKEKKQQYRHERYKNLPEDDKKSLLRIEKNIAKWEKTPYHIY